MHRLLLFAMLCLVLFIPVALADDDDEEDYEEDDYIEEFRSYLALTQDLVGMIDHPQTAVYFAIEAMVEIYEEEDDLEGATLQLEELLQRHGNQRYTATVLRYKLQDLYRIQERPRRARAHLEAMLRENVRHLPD